MKPGVRVFRYLAALTPLLGLALAGCGGLLGSVNGTGGTSGQPQARVVTISGQAAVENEIFGRTRQASDRAVTNADVRVRQVGAGGQLTDVPGATATTAGNGTFTVSLPIGTSNANSLFVLEVFGSVNGVNDRVLLMAPFVVGNNVNTLTVNVSVASTLVAQNLIAAAAAGQAGSFTEADILRSIAATQAIVRNPGSNADATFRATDLPTGADINTARGKLAALATRVAAVYNAIVARVDVTIQGSTAFTASTADAAQNKQLAIAQGQTLTLVGTALDSTGAVLATGIEFTPTSSAAFTLTQTGSNTASITGSSTLGAAASLTARIAVPGSTNSPRKSVTFTVRVVQHGQGHIQGGASGG